MKKENFRYGWRVIMLHQRNKEGRHNRPDYHSVKRISNSEDEFEEQLQELRKMKGDTPNLRIYASVNARNIDDAIRKFKFEQLEADYYDDEQRYQWYKDIKNRWIGALMTLSSRAETHFLIDCDCNEGESSNETRVILGRSTNILLEYETPNGVHFITEPYNPNETPGLEIKKDALMYIE